MNNFSIYENCILCPRKCGADRTKRKGACGQTAALKIGRASLHMWEEPCISGLNGSGTVFFSGCSLSCIYCQNSALSRNNTGKEASADRLCEIFLELMAKGAENINLVTPEHFAPHIAYALEKAKKNGLDIPIVMNCGGYTDTEALKMLGKYVDVFLPDFKYISPRLAKKLSSAENYPEAAKKALDEMVRLQPKCVFENGMIKKGVIVRHLCLPGHIAESKKALAYLHEQYGNNIYISIMSQYTPVAESEIYPELNRRLRKSEYDRILDYALSIGIENAFIQEGESASESFIPSFDGEGV